MRILMRYWLQNRSRAVGAASRRAGSECALLDGLFKEWSKLVWLSEMLLPDNFWNSAWHK